MSFEPKVKRRKWTDEEKHDTLKACGSRCACCNKKLTLETLTMEHVVPISKGGENISENLVALCSHCNSTKSNKLCWPKGYYMALQNSGKLNIIEKYTKEWISENVDLEYIKEFPMELDLDCQL